MTYKLWKVRLLVEFPDDGIELCEKGSMFLRCVNLYKERGTIILYKLWTVKLPVEFLYDGFKLCEYIQAKGHYHHI